MYQGIRPFVITGIALVGASAIAVAPVSVPPPEVHATPIVTTRRVVTSEVQLASLASLADYTFADAALLTGNAVFVNLPLLAVVLPTTVVIAFASGVGVPDLAFLVVNRFATIPLDVARPWAAALANSLPEPLGGVPVENSSTPGQGIIFDSFHAVNDAVRGLLAEIAPHQTLAKQAAGAAPVDDPWPPVAETAGRVLRDAVEGLVSLPTDLLSLSPQDRQTIGQYLDQGRALDAVRFVIHRSIIDVVEDLARPSVQLGTTFLPPPIGGHDPETGLIARVSEASEKATQHLLDSIEPDPPDAVVEHKAINSFKQQGGFVNLSPPGPNPNVDEISNVGANNVSNDPVITKTSSLDNNRPKPGSHVRAVVKEVRKDIRETLKDVRQGVRDVVKAVTGLGKKKDAKPETNPPGE